MNIDQIYQEAEKFFEFPTANRDHVTTTSAVLFAQHIAQQAHRQGWEQAKREADILLLDLVDVVLESKLVVQSARRAIAAMEYKEKAND